MRKPLLLAVAAMLGLSSCNVWYNDVPSPDDLMHHIPWFDHMIVAKSIAPYSSADVPRNTPAGAVPVGGGEANWGTGKITPGSIPSYGFDTLAAMKVIRPAHMTPSPAARSGEQLFDTYCAACHGANATGFRIPEIPAPSLLTAQARAYSDGYLYSMIRYGRGGMPQYGDKIPRIDERWAVVDYLRSLQTASPLPAAPPSASASKGARR